MTVNFGEFFGESMQKNIQKLTCNTIVENYYMLKASYRLKLILPTPQISFKDIYH